MFVGARSFHTRSQNGFTLVELMAAIALLGVIIVTAMPAYNMFRQRAYDALSKSDISNALRGVYSVQATDSDIPIVLFNQEGPIHLPAPLENYALSNGVVGEFIIRIPFDGLGDLIFISIYHPKGAFIYRELDIFGVRSKQKIAL